MKKSFSSHLDPFYSSRNLRPKSSYALLHSKSHANPHPPSHNFSKTSYYKPSFYNSVSSKYENNDKTYENSRSLTNKIIQSKTNLRADLLKNDTQTSSDSKNRHEIDEIFKNTPKKSKILRNNRSESHSKAYTEAMKALQMKLRFLEEENEKLKRKFVDMEREIEGKVEEKIREQTEFFVILETNLKEKIMMLEEEKANLQRRMENLEEKLQFFEEKSNMDYKEFIREKIDLRKALANSNEKYAKLRQENENFMKFTPENPQKNRRFVPSPYENTLELMHKQNELLKNEINKVFPQGKSSANNQEGFEIQQKLMQKSKEIENLTSQFNDFVTKNQINLVSKAKINTSSIGSVKKQKTSHSSTIKKETPQQEYENKTLDNMINNIISVNSQSSEKTTIFQHFKAKSTHEHAKINDSEGRKNLALGKEMLEIMKKYKEANIN